MIAPIKWLLKYTDVKAESPEEIHNLGSEMTLSGSKVEAIESKGADIQNVLVGYCFEVKDHENSDHLHVCQLDVGKEEPVQIVTGAPNIRANAHIPVALSGAIIAEGRKITSGKLRGVASNGMMCSFEEIGLDCNDYNSNNDGVMILEDVDMFKGMSKEELDKFIGKNIINVLGADDTVIEFEITSNRADCFSILGLSREAAITMGGKFAKPEINVTPDLAIKTADEIQVDVQAPDLCPRYCAWLVKDVKIEPSPKWMRDELSAAGVRPINNIVDITNYVMLEYGQPMHAVSGPQPFAEGFFDLFPFGGRYFLTFFQIAACPVVNIGHIRQVEEVPDGFAPFGKNFFKGFIKSVSGFDFHFKILINLFFNHSCN